MDMMNSIAATAMSMQQSRLQEAVSVSMMKKSMDQTEQTAAALFEMLPPPPSEYQLDVRA